MQPISIKIPRRLPPLLSRRCDRKKGEGWGYVGFHYIMHNNKKIYVYMHIHGLVATKTITITVQLKNIEKINSLCG